MSIALTKCAATFHQIIVRANPSSDPAWVDEFKASFEHQTGSAIGREADLTFGALAGGPCDLVYLDTAGNLLQIFFIPGHTAFDGSSEEPVITGYNLQLPPPNVLIGPDGSLAMAPGS